MVRRSSSEPSKVIRALTQFVEQPRVLDGDNGLISEVLYQCNLTICEGFDLAAVNADCAYQLLVLQHRNAEKSPRTRNCG